MRRRTKKAMTNYIMSIFILMVVTINPVWTYQLSDADNLIKDKMATYNKKLRPVHNQSKAIDISVGFELIAIQDLDEVQGKFSAMGYLSMLWVDEQMTWNETEYGGVAELAIESGDFWTPNLVLSNPFDQFVKLSDAWTLLRFINQYGYAVLSPGQLFVASCDINIEFYPWDTQVCYFSFDAYGYIRKEVTLNLMHDNVQFNYFSANSMWEIINSSATIVTTQYSTTAVFAFGLKRKPQFIIVNVILPIVIMSFLSVVVFLIPVESGERISYCLTVLLSIAVFLTLIGDSLPKTPSPMPILSWYLLSVMCISVLVTLCTVFSLMMYFREENKKVPYVLGRLARCLNCDCRNNNQDGRSKNIYQSAKRNQSKSKYNNNGVSQANEIVNGLDQNIQTNLNETFETKGDEITWKDVSFALDKVCFVFFLACLLLSTLLFGFRASETKENYILPTFDF